MLASHKTPSTASKSCVADFQDDHPKTQRRLHWSFLLLPAAVAAFLGTWQVGRRQWKVEQIKQRSDGLKVIIRFNAMAQPWKYGSLLHIAHVTVKPISTHCY